jgi:hypothetical protein
MSSLVLFQVVIDKINFILTRGIQHIPVPASSQEWEFSSIKACNMASDN